MNAQLSGREGFKCGCAPCGVARNHGVDDWKKTYRGRVCYLQSREGLVV